MPTVTSPAQSRLVFELTQEETYHIAASLASDISCAADLMPEELYQRHMYLLDMFMSKLSEPVKACVLAAVPWQGALQ